jgi:hypothetical protein
MNIDIDATYNNSQNSISCNHILRKYTLPNDILLKFIFAEMQHLLNRSLLNIHLLKFIFAEMQHLLNIYLLKIIFAEILFAEFRP